MAVLSAELGHFDQLGCNIADLHILFGFVHDTTQPRFRKVITSVKKNSGMATA